MVTNPLEAMPADRTPRYVREHMHNAEGSRKELNKMLESVRSRFEKRVRHLQNLVEEGRARETDLSARLVESAELTRIHKEEVQRNKDVSIELSGCMIQAAQMESRLKQEISDLHERIQSQHVKEEEQSEELERYRERELELEVKYDEVSRELLHAQQENLELSKKVNALGNRLKVAQSDNSATQRAFEQLKVDK